MLEPVFVKGHLNFSIDGRNLEFTHQNVSVFGVTGLPWPPLNPRDHFGRNIETTVHIPAATPLSFKCPAYIMREKTLYSEHMGIKFSLPAEDRERFSAYIAKNGFYPTEYMRKYPRIPSSAGIQTFPLRVLLSRGNGGSPHAPLVFDVANLSPNGLLLSTENQLALDMIPGERIGMVLEPRGWFPAQVKVDGTVCRVVDDLNPGSGNLIRYLGVKFTRVDEINRNVFLELLKDILERIKAKSQTST